MSLLGDDQDDDRPYGDPERAANIRWESRPKSAVRRTGEATAAVATGTARAVAWPIKKIGIGLVRLGGAITGAGYETYNQGRDLWHWRRDD